jgi:hypothetical protein
VIDILQPMAVSAADPISKIGAALHEKEFHAA